jgi:hypothetical protein
MLAPTTARRATPLLVAAALAACQAQGERGAGAARADAAPIEASARAGSYEAPPFALFVADLGEGALGVALVAPDGSTLLAGEWSRAEGRFQAHTLTLLERFAVELATAPERTFDLTQELAPEAIVALVDLGDGAHRAQVLGGFEGDARAAADQLALAAATLGSLLSWMPAERATASEEGGLRDAARGFFPHACAELARYYALSAESSGVRALIHAEPITRETCDARFLEDLRAEATLESEPFVELVHAAARAYGWRAWPATVGR